MKAGDDSVQLLVSTQDHLYDIDGCESGRSAWQSVGVWGEDVVIKVTDIIRDRQPIAGSPDPGRGGRPAGVSGHGQGRTLAEFTGNASERGRR